jgi:hypothetical protein
MTEARALAVQAIEGEGPAAPLGPALRALLLGGDDAREDALAALGIGPAAAFARSQRDAWLAEAARLAAPGARPWARARALLALAVASERARGRLPAGELLRRHGPGAVALQRAELWGSLPGTLRRLYAALVRTDAQGVAASAGAVGRCDHTPPRQEAA